MKKIVFSMLIALPLMGCFDENILDDKVVSGVVIEQILWQTRSGNDYYISRVCYRGVVYLLGNRIKKMALSPEWNPDGTLSTCSIPQKVNVKPNLPQ